MYSRILQVAIFVIAPLLAITSCNAIASDSFGADPVTSSTPAIGDQIKAFVLPDIYGTERSLEELAGDKVVVLFFTGTQCPLAKLYAGRLQEIAESYEHDVAIVAVCSNVQDSLKDIQFYAQRHGIKFPILRDQRNKVADLVGATRTPEVFVVDQTRRLRYSGRIDGQFTFGSGVGLSQPVAKRNDLLEALDEILAGKPVSVPRTEVKGCLIGRAKVAKENAEVTYSKQIVRLFQTRCQECHREGQIAPFALEDYSEAAGWGEMIAEVVREQRMPPWHADPEFGHFSNENVLSAEEKQLVYDWVDAGCPEGDPSDLPEPIEYRDGWFLGREPDQVIHMTDKPVSIKADGIEDYRYYEVDPGFTEDKWVSLSECMPGNKAVVHHQIVYIKSPQAKKSIGDFELLVGFAPGTRPVRYPKGWARRIPAGSKLVFEMHYTPIGSPQTDRSSVGLVYIDPSEVTHQTWTTNAINTKLTIPAFAEQHTESASRTFKQDVTLLSLYPHMHMRGKSFRYDLKYPNGRTETLLNVPEYDFNWQNSFILEKPIKVPAGAKMLCTAVFDNSEGNLANPDPGKIVRWGEQTWDEMLIGWHDVAVPIER